MANLKNLLSSLVPFLLIGFLCVGCANTVPVKFFVENNDASYGFWGGFLHGVIAPFAFIGSLFSENIAIYAVSNSGRWYDFGFVLGAVIFVGGVAGAGNNKEVV